jgi:hypothetical protein
MAKVLLGATPVAGTPDAFTARAVHERILSASGVRLVSDAEVVRNTLVRAVDAGKIAVRLGDGRVFDAKGSVEGVAGHRRRNSAKLPVAFSLDDSVQISPATSATAAEWLTEDDPTPPAKPGDPPNPPGNGGGGGPPPPPPPPSQVSATSWTQILTYAKDRPLLKLELRAPTPAVAATLATLAQPLGADSLTVSVTVSGDAKDGGSVNFQATDLKLNHPTKPLNIAQTMFNSLTDGCAFEAVLCLIFSGGRPGMGPALDNLKQSASADVKPTGVFDKPAA